ncbi:MAG: HzsA-related protein [Thermogutta sp.]
MKPRLMQTWPSVMVARLCLLGIAALAASVIGACPTLGEVQHQRLDSELVGMVENDWQKQEARLGRSCDSIEAMKAALQRIEWYLKEAEEEELLSKDVRCEAAGTLKRFWERAALASVLSADERLQLYREIRWFGRDVLLKNRLFAQRPIVFLKTRRFICQMLHEYIAYFYNAADLHGGGVYVLKEPGFSLELEDLTAGRFPRGIFQSLSLSYDARTAYFAFAPILAGDRRRPLRPDWSVLTAGPFPPEFAFESPNRPCFHIFAIDLQTREIQQLTEGRYDDTMPWPLPNGDLVFMSTRRGGFCRCNNPWEPIQTYTLHRLKLPSGQIETISFHETNEWHPSVLNDGRIAYCRWDYVDRSAAHFHGIWVTTPDGTNARSVFGNYTMEISTCFQPRPIPGSRKIAFIAGAHHAVVGGSLVLFDPDKARYDPETGEDSFVSLEVLTPQIVFPETSQGWSEGYVVSPWPLSEDFFIIAFGHDRLPGISSGNRSESAVGIYYFDRWGNLELLYEDPGMACLDPIPMIPRNPPPLLQETFDPELGEAAEVIVYDVRRSHFPLPADRPIRELRVFQLLPKARHPVNDPRIGHANAENARALLGTVPVEEDGSAYFRVPANRPLYFQIVDEQGRAVQGMRSVTYFRPGERRGCIGCHEPPNTTVPTRDVLALRREPFALTPGPEGSRPFSFPRLVQPVLDQFCTRCHSPEAGSRFAPPDLTGHPQGEFTRSYVNLRPYLRWYEWGGASISQIVTRPGELGADASPLLKILQDPTHRQAVRLDQPALSRLTLWLDANVPFYGAYEPSQRAEQRLGALISLPELQ